MDNINWVSDFIYFALIITFILAFVVLLIIVIILAIKKRSIKVPIITFVAITVTFSITAGCNAFSNYQKDKWFYSFKSDVMKQYKIVKNIDFDPCNVSLSLFLYCDENTDVKGIEPIFNTIKNYLFNNPSGSNPSQQSYLKRGRGEYTQIYISFHTAKTKKTIVCYEAWYYTNGFQDKIDNFKTWRINHKSEMTK